MRNILVGYAKLTLKYIRRMEVVTEERSGCSGYKVQNPRTRRPIARNPPQPRRWGLIDREGPARHQADLTTFSHSSSHEEYRWPRVPRGPKILASHAQTVTLQAEHREAPRCGFAPVDQRGGGSDLLVAGEPEHLRILSSVPSTQKSKSLAANTPGRSHSSCFSMDTSSRSAMRSRSSCITNWA